MAGRWLLMVAVGGELAYLHHERNLPVAVKAPEREVIADDDLVFLKKKRPRLVDGLEGAVWDDGLGVGRGAAGVLSLCGADGAVRQERGDAAGGGADR